MLEEFIKIVDRWLEWIITRREREEDSRDARLLASAGKLVGAMVELDETFTSLFTKVLELRYDSSHETIHNTISDIRVFAGSKKFLGLIHESISGLRGFKDKERLYTSEIENLIPHAERFLNTLGPLAFTPFENYNEFFELEKKLRSRISEEIEEAIGLTIDIINRVDSNSVIAARQAFKNLETTVYHQNRSLPYAEWSLILQRDGRIPPANDISKQR